MDNKTKRLTTPLGNELFNNLEVGDQVLLSGKIYAGRDAVLPKIIKLYKEGRLDEFGIDLQGSVIFHTAVSVAGVGPTSSNKFEIESNIPVLSEAGVKIHLGKGELGKDTIAALAKYGSMYAVIPPVTALLGSKTVSSRLIAYPELGMEAFYELTVEDYPMIIAANKGQSIYDK